MATSLTGIVSLNKIPVARTVRCYLESTGALVASTTSSAVDGTYTITGLTDATGYYLTVIDTTSTNSTATIGAVVPGSTSHNFNLVDRHNSELPANIDLASTTQPPYNGDFLTVNTDTVIYGLVKFEGVVSAKKVYCYNTLTGAYVNTATSSASYGTFSFTGLSTFVYYDVVVVDESGKYNTLCAGSILPSAVVHEFNFTTEQDNANPVDIVNGIPSPIPYYGTSAWTTTPLATQSITANAPIYTSQGAFSFPTTTVIGYGGATLHASFPSTTITATGTTTLSGQATINFPSASVVASGITGVVGTFEGVSRNFTTITALGGASFTGSFPKSTLTASATVSISAQGVFPFVTSTVTASGTTGLIGLANISFPTISSRYGIARLSGFTTTLTASSVFSTAHAVAYVMNLENGAITQYLNYAFDKIVNFNSKYYGIKADGVYLLEGNTDAGTNIDARIELPPHDYGSSKRKRCGHYHIDTSDTTYVTPKYDGTSCGPYLSTHAGRKTKIGKGGDGRYWGMVITNSSGGTMNINSVELDLFENRRIN